MSLTIKELLDKQLELDNTILSNTNIRSGVVSTHQDHLEDRLLALSVEVAELSNATRCFKYWSIKPRESKVRLLDELADVVHFTLSVAISLGFEAEEIEQAYLKKHEENYKRQRERY